MEDSIEAEDGERGWTRGELEYRRVYAYANPLMEVLELQDWIVDGSLDDVIKDLSVFAVVQLDGWVDLEGEKQQSISTRNHASIYLGRYLRLCSSSCCC